MLKKQLAMVCVLQKPTQNNRNGEVVEELPGSGKSVACVKRDTTELGRPNWFPGNIGVGKADRKKVNRRPVGSQISS
jgi:hypothetical protein